MHRPQSRNQFQHRGAGRIFAMRGRRQDELGADVLGSAQRSQGDADGQERSTDWGTMAMPSPAPTSARMEWVCVMCCTSAGITPAEWIKPMTRRWK